MSRTARAGAAEVGRIGRVTLRFGTAGLRAPLGDGPADINLPVVLRATWAVATVLKDRCLGGSTVIVGHDARHGSAEFALGAAEVLAGHGFSVTMLPRSVPTPVVAFAVRHTGAAAGIQITASHNPATDNGYKVYFDGGMQVVSPTDREIEAAIAVAPGHIVQTPVAPTGAELIEKYIARAAGIRRGTGAARIALTPLHGVGGATAVEVLHRAGFTDVHTVARQFAPDPDFPTTPFPNPEEPGVADAVLELAADVHADVAVALDPDADRCAVGVPTGDGWRMLSGDETGWLLGDYILSQAPPGVTVASTVVSSRMLAAIAAAHHARHVETLTGFKWLARAGGSDLIYAYEEALGHCVDPAAVRDKDGITAAVLFADLVATLGAQGRSVHGVLDELARRHGVHVTKAVTVRSEHAAGVMARLRAAPPPTLAGHPVHVHDLLTRRGSQRTDSLILIGTEAPIRLAVRPSGTEPKIKCYIEVRQAPTDDVRTARASADTLAVDVARDAMNLVQRGPN
ncbi:MAG: phospho-sugar mutase [Mycobacteriaceae bacterium]|nr:phospho-sugar mutase [Mycobacteriaceae bacterium]